MGNILFIRFDIFILEVGKKIFDDCMELLNLILFVFKLILRDDWFLVILVVGFIFLIVGEGKFLWVRDFKILLDFKFCIDCCLSLLFFFVIKCDKDGCRELLKCCDVLNGFVVFKDCLLLDFVWKSKELL